jgi:hypothetical protein
LLAAPIGDNEMAALSLQSDELDYVANQQWYLGFGEIGG